MHTLLSKETNQMQLEKAVGGQESIESSLETMLVEMEKSEEAHMKFHVK